jgi:hypothetical protein
MKKNHKYFFSIAAIIVAVSLPLASHAYAITNPQNNGVGLQGEVAAPAPTVAASIVSPANGANFTAVPITLTGSCPANTLVKIFKNGVFGGAVACQAGAYSIQVDLFSGQNELKAIVYDSLNQAGPDSKTITVNYTNVVANPALSSLVTLTSNFGQRGANPKQELTWPIIISGGSAPYAVSVDWGDLSPADVYSQTAVGQFTIKHTYQQAGLFKVLIKAVDQNGVSAFLQLSGVANGQVVQSSVAGASTTKTPSVSSVTWQVFAFSFSAIIVTFWLGRGFGTKTVKSKLQRGEHPFGE